MSLETDGKIIGRPKKRWLDNIAANINALQITEDLSVDQIDWRKQQLKKNPEQTRGRRTQAAENRRR